MNIALVLIVIAITAVFLFVFLGKPKTPAQEPTKKPKVKKPSHSHLHSHRVAVHFTTRERGVDTEWQHLMNTAQSDRLTLLAVLDDNTELFARYEVAKDACPVVLLLDHHGQIVSRNQQQAVSYTEQLKGLI